MVAPRTVRCHSRGAPGEHSSLPPAPDSPPASRKLAPFVRHTAWLAFTLLCATAGERAMERPASRSWAMFSPNAGQVRGQRGRVGQQPRCDRATLGHREEPSSAHRGSLRAVSPASSLISSRGEGEAELRLALAPRRSKQPEAHRPSPRPRGADRLEALLPALPSPSATANCNDPIRLLAPVTHGEETATLARSNSRVISQAHIVALLVLMRSLGSEVLPTPRTLRSRPLASQLTTDASRGETSSPTSTGDEWRAEAALMMLADPAVRLTLDTGIPESSPQPRTAPPRV